MNDPETTPEHLTFTIEVGDDRALTRYKGDPTAVESEPISPLDVSARMQIGMWDTVLVNDIIAMRVEGFTDDGRGEERLLLTPRGPEDGKAFFLAHPASVTGTVLKYFNGNLELEIDGSIPTAPGEGQWLYFMFGEAYPGDEQGDLLYIGISGNAPVRWTQHQSDKRWFRDVTRFERIWYPTRKSVEAAEIEAIALYRPRHNIKHNPRKSGFSPEVVTPLPPDPQAGVIASGAD